MPMINIENAIIEHKINMLYLKNKFVFPLFYIIAVRGASVLYK